MKGNKGIIKRKEQGITLIALVITIIVLLILAGVSIAMLTGENGILTQAQNAKNKTNEAAKNEQLDLAKQEDLINESLNGVEVEQVTDTAPGVLEENGTEYTINSIEDLVFFAYDVTNGNNYEGKTVKLGISLDFNSTKSYVDPFRTDYEKYGYSGELKTLLTSGEGFKSIGITTEDDEAKNWGGTFDGNNNFINNLYINVTTNAEFERRGLFTNNFGTISNLKLTNVNLYLKCKKGTLAGISGQNSSTGSINNCIVTGNIKNESLLGSSGGITGYCSGRISNCGNMANVYLHTTDLGSGSNCGGIFTSTGTNSEIINCYNTGTIFGKSDTDDLFVGGIGGTTGGKIKNCYNTGNISGEGTEILRVGGIVGNIYGNSEMNSCYSTGIVKGNQATDPTIGMIIGKNDLGITQNIYYKKVDETPGIGLIVGNGSEDELLMQKTEEQMKEDSFVDLLNSGNEEVVWKKDTSNINNGYPILEWE